MNWNKGLLRVWVVAAVLWAAAVAGYGAVALGGRPVASGVYAYSAAEDGFVPQQLAVTDGVLEDGVARGVIARIELDGGATLFAPRALGEERLEELTERFRDGHGPVGARTLLPWALGALLPPVGILLTGMLLSWILRGFRTGAAVPAMADAAPVEEASKPAGAAATAGWTSSSASLPPFIRTLGPVQRRGRTPTRVPGQTGR